MTSHQSKKPIGAAWTKILAAIVAAGVILGAGVFFAPELQTGQLFGGSAPEQAAGRSAQLVKDFPQYFSQPVKWGQCPSGQTAFECALILAPLNWNEPASSIAPDFSPEKNPYDSAAQASIQLLIERSAARSLNDSAEYLFTNPGGPGASGTAFIEGGLDMFSPKLRYKFNLASWDPRGTSPAFNTPGLGTSALKCYANDFEKLQDIYSEVPGEMPENIEAVTAQSKKGVDKCKELSGSLIRFVDTESSARDLELISSLLSSGQTNFFGFSYGTALGATYAGLFPERVGKFVLDGADDQSISELDQALGQALGFETELNEFLKDCIGASAAQCPFAGKDLAYAQSWISTTIRGLRGSPIPIGGGRQFNETMFVQAIIQSLYSKDYWQYLRLGLNLLKTKSNVQVLEMLSDLYFDYSDGRFENNMIEANGPISCLDRSAEFDLEKAKLNAEEIKKAAPILADSFTFSGLGCSEYPQAQKTDFDKSAPGANPILVIGTTRDPATPFKNAQNMAKQLESGILLGFDSDGHTAYSPENGVVSDAVDEFILNDVAPESGKVLSKTS